MIVKRRLSDVDPLGPVAASLGIATLLVTPFAAATCRTRRRPPTRSRRVAVLGLLCSALAFLFFFRLIAEVGPGKATVITYINPVVALALGVAILDESVTTGVVVGLLLILAGSWLSTDGRVPPGLAALAGRVRGAGVHEVPRLPASKPLRFQQSSGRCWREGDSVPRSLGRWYWGRASQEGGAS